MKLSKKDLISMADLSKREINLILNKAGEFKKQKTTNLCLAGKTLAMIFEKPSTRTRVSFEVAMYQLGGFPVSLNADEIQLSRGETIHDTAKVLSGYVNGITIRTYSHRNIEDLAKYAEIPVINSLSDLEHPCQILADLFTIHEKRGLNGIKIAFVGDGDNNVTNSLILGCSIMDIELTVSSPKGYEPKKSIMELAKKLNPKNNIKINNVPRKAVRNADVVYTDVWVSMGLEKEYKKRKKDFKDFQLNKNLLKYVGNKDYLIMHCLPAHRGDEITNDVIDSVNSVVFMQAKNRLYTQKAILFLLLGGTL